MENTARSRPSWAAALLLSAVLCVASVLIARQLTRSSDALAAIDLSCQPSQQIETLGDGLLYSDGMTLHALDGRGGQRWTYTIGSSSDFYAYDGGVSVWSGRTLTLLSGDGELLFSGSAADTVLSARLGSLYAAALVGEEDRASIVVMDRGGQALDTISVTGVTVLDFGFFYDGRILWVLTLNTDGSVPVCTVTTYTPGSMLEGSVSDADQLVYKVLFRSNSILTVGTSYARTLDYMGVEDESARALLYGWSLLSVGGEADDPVLVLTRDAQAESGRVRDVRLLSSRMDRTIRMPFDCFAVAAKGRAVYGFTGAYVIRRDMLADENLTLELPVKADALIALTDAGAAVVASEGKAYLVPLA